MNVSIQDLPENVAAIYEATAQSRGVSLASFLRDNLIVNAPAPPPTPLRADEWEKALDECFDSFPSSDPLPDNAFDRENIYVREDKW